MAETQPTQTPTQSQTQSSDLDEAFAEGYDEDLELDEELEEDDLGDEDPDDVDPEDEEDPEDDEEDEDVEEDDDEEDDGEENDGEENDEEDEDDDKKEEGEDDRPGQPQFQREEWDSAAPDDSTVVEYQRRDTEALFLSGLPCSDPSCQNLENRAEDAWIKLVSAIPQAGQVPGLTVVAEETPAPSQQQVRNLVYLVRPDNSDRYALRQISTHWQQFRTDFDTDPEAGIAPNLKTGLRALADHWKGDDFDAFAEQVEIVMANCATVCDDIGDTSTGAVGLLEQKADEFYGLQGGDSGELPYPAPMYWIADPGQMFTAPIVHVRAPFSNGDCKITDGCGHSGGILGELLELGGFNPDYVDEVANYVEAQTQYYINKGRKLDPPTTPEQAALWAQADANNNMAEDITAGVDDYESRSRIANEDVVNRWENAEDSAGTFAPEARPSNPSNFREASDMLVDYEYEGLDPGSGALQAGDPPPAVDGAGDSPWGGGGGLEPPGGASGGLASGGATLGSGGSFPVGPASSTVEGGGGSGAAGSASAGGRGMGGGMMGGMGGGGRGGAGGEQQPEGEHRDWLEEDEEIWGIRAIDDDPYA
jgi:hypothetical protein